MDLILPGASKAIHVNVTTIEGHVVIQFSRPIQELPLDAQAAAELARALAQIVRELTGIQSY